MVADGQPLNPHSDYDMIKWYIHMKQWDVSNYTSMPWLQHWTVYTSGSIILGPFILLLLYYSAVTLKHQQTWEWNNTVFDMAKKNVAKKNQQRVPITVTYEYYSDIFFRLSSRINCNQTCRYMLCLSSFFYLHYLGIRTIKMKWDQYRLISIVGVTYLERRSLYWYKVLEPRGSCRINNI